MMHSINRLEGRTALRDEQEQVSLRRNMLLAARNPEDVQSKIDCADQALRLGLRDTAKALYEMAFLRTGFAADHLRWQSRVSQQTGLWGTPSSSDEDQIGAKGCSIDIAVHELKGLLIAPHLTSPLPVDAFDLQDDLVQTLEPVGVEARPQPIVSIKRDALAERPIPRLMRVSIQARLMRSAVPPVADVFGTCATLFTLLRASKVNDGLETALEQARQIFLTPLPFDIDGSIDDCDRMAAALIATDLRHFLLVNYALGYRPLGSAETLHATARLTPAGLGAYFSNVPRLLRDWRDVFGLLHLAAGGPPDDDISARWIPLLATHVDGSTLHEIIDELGDQGLQRPLRIILAGLVRQSDLRRDKGLLWKLRDAGLDNDDLALAGWAQRTVAIWAHDDKTEWRILGEIQAKAGAYEDAEYLFQIGWSIAPDDDDFPTRIAALDAWDASDFVIGHGFGTSPERLRRRLARRGHLAARPA